MARIKGENAVHVPASAVEVKPWFRAEPSRATLRSIKDHIRETGDVLTCEEVTFNKPCADSEIRYVGEFELPDRYRRLKLFAPCPICTSGHRKFGAGKIAWFPGEGVIRLIGPECFKTLNKDAHEQAQRAYDLEVRRRNATRYLLDRADDLRATSVAVQNAEKQAAAIDRFASQLQYKTEEQLNMGLWSAVKTGELSVWGVFRDLQGRTGEVRELTAPKLYARIRGASILNPRIKVYVRELRNVERALAQLDDLGEWRARIERMPDTERFEACRLISRTVGTARRLLEEMGELQQFVEPENINTLRVWGARDDCACPTFITRVGSKITIGRHPKGMLPVLIPPHFSDPLPEIPALTLKEFEQESEKAEQSGVARD